LPDRLHKSQPVLFFLFAQSLKKNICIFPSIHFKKLFPVPIGRYHILPNPFRSFYDSSAVDRIASSYGNNFIAVGQLNYQKNHEFMIRSFSIYVRIHSPDSRLFIYGTGEYGDALACLVESLNMSSNIFLRGWSKQPWCEHRYDYHLLTSRWEGYPNVVVEAAHFRIPTLATPIQPGIHTIITENNIGLVSADTSMDTYVDLLTKSPSLQCRFRESSHSFDDFVALHSPELLIGALSSYV
jgi:glycosyltransferase involved in cell wall biosynthesis